MVRIRGRAVDGSITRKSIDTECREDVVDLLGVMRQVIVTSKDVRRFRRESVWQPIGSSS